MPRGRECARCGRTDDVCKYVIDYTDKPRRLTINLCEDHSDWLEQLDADFPPVKHSQVREERQVPHSFKLTSEWKIKQLRADYRRKQKEDQAE